MNLKFELIIAYYKRPKIVLNALESIIKMDYENWHLTFIDDSGNDDFRETFLNYGFDKNKIEYVPIMMSDDEKIGGSIFGKYVNDAIIKTDADGIILLCDDDAIFPNYLTNLNNYFNENPDKVWCHSHIKFFNPEKEHYSQATDNPNYNKTNANYLNRNINAINPSCRVDNSQIAFRKKAFTEKNIWYPYPCTKDLDRNVFEQMVKGWGLCDYLDCYSQYKGWFENQLGVITKKNGEELIAGKYVSIHEYNIFFRDVTLFILEHFDTPDRENHVIILGSYIFHPTSYFKELYPNKKIIIYQLEQIVKSNWHNNEFLNWIAQADEVWEYDVYNSEILNHKGIKHTMINFRYCKSLDKSLNDTNEYDIDILFYGFLNHRRLNIIEPLQQMNYGKISFVYAFGIYGDKLDEYIKRSKIILNIHAFDENRQEQVRMLRLLCNGKMIISEHSQPSYFSDYIREFSSLEGMNSLIHEYIKDDKFKEFGEISKQKFINKIEIPQVVPHENITEIRKLCVINAIQKSPPQNVEVHKKYIYGFWHIWAVNNYFEIITEQLQLMVSSGLYSECKEIQTIIVGTTDNVRNVIELLKSKNKINIINTYSDERVFEFPILSLIKQSSKYVEGYYFYIHTKGVTYPNDLNSKKWRDYMNHYIITQWKDDVKKLDEGYETCGVKWMESKKFWEQHYSGNFWWCRSKYLDRCPFPESLKYNIDSKWQQIQEKDKVRVQAEMWIGKGNPLWATLSQEFIDY